ncbi:MAG: hypothetical protein KJN64_14765 [Ignavibacteria bacterium]|nr:hypothetical protein [Ignavibacteria bacterium]MBT8391140.1 hypothetical protein [Ignavibacteria bacterium]NNJ52162.1 hypothetical protein [Ignavibacteriaceae bacterium]NNL20017.1 hypothetical protein [Ignavibacteriaceae bacterium]
MKNLIFVFSFFFFSGMLYAQADTTIILNEDVENFAVPEELEIEVGKTVKFMTTGAEFRILILDAFDIFENEDSNVTIDLNSDSPESAIYKLKKRATSIEKIYFIFCITNNTWIEAPPRIVLNAAR